MREKTAGWTYAAGNDDAHYRVIFVDSIACAGDQSMELAYYPQLQHIVIIIEGAISRTVDARTFFPAVDQIRVGRIG